MNYYVFKFFIESYIVWLKCIDILNVVVVVDIINLLMWLIKKNLCIVINVCMIW